MLAVDPSRPTESADLEGRIMTIVISRGRAGITRDELLRKLGVAYDELMASLDDLSAHGRVRVHWPTPDSFRVFHAE